MPRPAPSRPHPSRNYLFLLLTLLALIFSLPLLEIDGWGGPIVGAVASISMLFGLRAVATEKRTLRVAFGLGLIGFTCSTTCYFLGLSPLAAQPFQFAFYGYLTLSILRSVLEARVITADVICGGIAVYLLLGICWAILYAIFELLAPGSIREANGFDPDGITSAMDFVYFSFVTLTTLGYGDIVPVGDKARAAAMFEAIAGLLFIAVFIGRLVALTTTPPSGKDE